MRVLVTGGAGFVGGHVCEALLRDGWQVTVLDCLRGGREENVPDEASFVRADISRWSGCAATIPGASPEVIVHLAAQADVVRSCEAPLDDADTNVIGLLHVLRAAEQAGTRRIVFASSGGTVYGPDAPLPTPEDAPLDPVCPYGISKVAGEWHIRHWAERNGREAVCLRLGNVFGPRDHRGVITKFARARLSGDVPTVYVTGARGHGALRDYVFVEEVARAFVEAAKGEQRAPNYNIGSGVARRTEDVLAVVDACCGIGAAAPPATREPLRKGEVPFVRLDSSRAVRDLGSAVYDEASSDEWARRRHFAADVGRTVEWVASTMMEARS